MSYPSVFAIPGPNLLSYSSAATLLCFIYSKIYGIVVFICWYKIFVNFFVNDSVEKQSRGNVEYIGLFVKNSLSAFKLSVTGTLFNTSSWQRFLTPTYPYRSGTYVFFNIFVASSPLFIMSIFVKHPIDLSPLGSIYLISFKA